MRREKVSALETTIAILRKEIELRETKLTEAKEQLKLRDGELGKVKDQLVKVNAELEGYDIELREKEQRLTEKMQQNQTFLNLLLKNP